MKRIVVPTIVASLVAVAAYMGLPRLEVLGVADQFFPVQQKPEDPELQRLKKKWGEVKHSYHDEELFILEFFQGRKNGVFVDVGAFDYKKYSNTYRLENEFDWGGIAVDALDEFRAGYELHRTKTKFFNFYISDTSNVPMDFFVVEGRKSQSTGLVTNAETKTEKWDVSTIEVLQITLDELLEHEGIERIDFLNMDIELAEPAALRGFDIERFRPELVCIEAHPPVVPFLEQYFAEHGYEKIKLWSELDVFNSYYTPRKGS